MRLQKQLRKRKNKLFTIQRKFLSSWKIKKDPSFWNSYPSLSFSDRSISFDPYGKINFKKWNHSNKSIWEWMEGSSDFMNDFDKLKS